MSPKLTVTRILKKIAAICTKAVIDGYCSIQIVCTNNGRLRNRSVYTLCPADSQFAAGSILQPQRMTAKRIATAASKSTVERQLWAGNDSHVSRIVLHN